MHFFVLNPALIGEGGAAEVIVVLATALLGVYLVGSALQGYIAGFGNIGSGAVPMAARVLLLIGGLFFAAPGDVIPGVSHLHMTLIGIVLCAPVLLFARTKRRREEAAIG